METARWRDTINLDDLWEGDMAAVAVDGETVLLVNVDGTVRAYSNRCPHQASALDEGDLDGETLTCAKHLWEFNAVTGGGINPDDARLTSYGCQVGDDGTIYVDIAAANSSAPSASPSDSGPQSRSPALTGAAMVLPGGASGHSHASLYRQDG